MKHRVCKEDYASNPSMCACDNDYVATFRYLYKKGIFCFVLLLIVCLLLLVFIGCYCIK